MKHIKKIIHTKGDPPMNSSNKKLLIISAILLALAVSLVFIGGCSPKEITVGEGSSEISLPEAPTDTDTDNSSTPDGIDSSHEGTVTERPYYSPSPDEILTAPIDDHYLRDIKDIYRWEVFDKGGKIVEEYVNSYEFATRNYSAPISDEVVTQLVKRGLSEEKAKSMTEGEYQTHIGNLPMDGWYVSILEKYGLTEEDYKDWKNIDAKNFRHSKEFKKFTYEYSGKDRQYTDEQLEKFNSFGITAAHLHTLSNKSVFPEDLMKMTKEEVWEILNSTGE